VTVAAEVETLLAGGGEADDLLRDTVGLLHERLGRVVRISFVEGDGLVPGVAAALAPYALVGWDTGGEAWTPLRREMAERPSRDVASPDGRRSFLRPLSPELTL